MRRGGGGGGGGGGGRGGAYLGLRSGVDSRRVTSVSSVCVGVRPSACRDAYYGSVGERNTGVAFGETNTLEIPNEFLKLQLIRRN